MQTKICNTCDQEKPLDEFHKNGNDRYQAKCKECQRFYEREKRKHENENKRKDLKDDLVNRVLMNKRLTL